MKIGSTLFTRAPSAEKRFTQQEVDASFMKGQQSQAATGNGAQEAAQNIEEQKSIDKSTVAGLVKQSNRILLAVSSHMFPFDIFPDTITVEVGRITIITRHFFMSSQIHSIDIKNISNIFINMAPFFAELVIVSKTFEENEIHVKFLRKNEAIFARRIIEGLRVFDANSIDTSNYSQKELLTKLQELSTTKIVS